MNAQPKEKHLELIQGVITRMANNGFLLKAWSVTLVAAVLALSADKPSPSLLLIGLLPALLFWGLDGYFLAQERLFRDLYNRVIDPAQQAPDFSLGHAGLTPLGWLKATFSLTLVPFHGVLTGVVIGLVISAA